MSNGSSFAAIVVGIAIAGGIAWYLDSLAQKGTLPPFPPLPFGL